MDFFCEFMVELGVAVVMVVAWPWVSRLRFLGLSWGGVVAMGFGG